MDAKSKETNESNDMDVDEVLETTGPCGRFQGVLQIVFMVLVLTTGYHGVMNYFTANDPPWKCVGKNSSTFCKHHFGKTISSDNELFYRRCALKRDEWTYTTGKDFSFVTEFDLVCDETSIAALVSGAFYIGGLFSCILSGLIADKYGRRIVLISWQLISVASSIGCSYVSNVWQLMVLRMILGGSQMSLYSIGFIMLTECVAPTYRNVSGNFYQMTFCLSQFTIDVAAYFERNWRPLQFYSSFPVLVSLVLFFFVPASPRWLSSVGRKCDAKLALEKISKCNRKEITDFRIKSQTTSTKTKYTYIHLFTNLKVFVVTSVLSTTWMIVALLYFAIAFESSNLGGNFYQAFALCALADLPAYFAALFAYNRYGRKKSVLLGEFSAGIFIACLAFVPRNYEHKYIINVVLAMLAKFCVNFTFNGIFLWTVEIFPTVLRSQGMSYCVAWERLGAFGAPFVISVLQSVNYILPYILMSAASIGCSLLGLLLPETNNLPTRENYKDFFNKPDNTINTKDDNKEIFQIGSINKGMHMEDFEKSFV